jgi:beta-lactam-binding protein with PASTA domain
MVVACGSNPTTSPSTVTVTQSSVAAPSFATSAPQTSAVETATTTATAASITIPDLTGENAKIAEDRLKGLGLTNITLSSANPKYQNVFVPANWTVVSIEPAPGSTVKSSDDVIIKVTKE